jgi:endoglucanase
MKHVKWMAAIVGLAGLVSALSPVETYGALSIKNAQLVDSAENPVTLRGMSLFWHNDVGGKEYWKSGAMKWCMTDWHASVIRAPIGVEDHQSGVYTITGVISDSLVANQRLRIAIEAAITYGFYVIVDWHTEKIYKDEAKAWFGYFAKKYGNTPNIIWEIYNEPNGPSWSEIAAYAKVVIPEIRKYSKNVILVGNSSWDQHPDEAGTELDQYSNIAYTVHFYSDHSFFSVVDAAMKKGHAVFASEFGLSTSSGDGGVASTSSGNIGTWLSTLNSAGVSHVNWDLGAQLANSGAGPGVQSSAALNTGAGYDGNWTDAELTASGKAMRSYLISKNPAWTVSDTALKVTSPLTITSDKTTNFIVKQDTVEFSAGYNKDVSWTLTETGRTSKATKATTGKTKSVYAAHLAGAKDLLGSAFQLGETVDVTLEPKSQKLSYTLSTTTGVVQRVHETTIHWVGSRLSLPGNLIPEGKSVQVTLRNSMGQVVFHATATVGSYGQIELVQRPRSQGIQILDIATESAVVRSAMAPNF